MGSQPYAPQQPHGQNQDFPQQRRSEPYASAFHKAGHSRNAPHLPQHHQRTSDRGKPPPPPPRPEPSVWENTIPSPPHNPQEEPPSPKPISPSPPPTTRRNQKPPPPKHEFPTLNEANLGKKRNRKKKPTLRELEYSEYVQRDRMLSRKFFSEVRKEQDSEVSSESESPPEPVWEDGPKYQEVEGKRSIPQKLILADFLEPYVAPPTDRDELVRHTLREEHRYHNQRREHAIMPVRDWRDQPPKDNHKNDRFNAKYCDQADEPDEDEKYFEPPEHVTPGDKATGSDVKIPTKGGRTTEVHRTASLSSKPHWIRQNVVPGCHVVLKTGHSGTVIKVVDSKLFRTGGIEVRIQIDGGGTTSGQIQRFYKATK